MPKKYNKYEQEVKKAFINTLDKIDISRPVEERRMMFYVMIKSPHWGVFSKYMDIIYRDVLTWSGYDGKVVLDYQPIYTTKLTRFEFGYPIEILT